MFNHFTDCMGALAPVEATPEMTRPVGQRNGQLFVAPGEATIPDPSLGKDNDVLMVEDNKWVISDKIYSDIVKAESDISELNEGYNSVIANSEQLLNELSTYRDDLAELIGIEPTDLATMLTAISDGITAVRTASNMFGTNIQSTDKFAESDSIYASKINTTYNAILSRLRNILVDQTSANIQSSLSDIESLKDVLKTTINSLYPAGSEPIDNTTPFSEYYNYITTETPAGYYRINLATDNGSLYAFYIDEFNVPTTDDNGDTVSTTLNKSSIFYGSLWPFYFSKKINIPNHYTEIDDFYGGTINSAALDTVEEINIDGNPDTTLFLYDTRRLTKFHILRSNQEYLNNSSSSSNRDYIEVRGGDPTRPVNISFPNLIKVSPNANSGVCIYASPSSDPGSPISTTVNFPELTILGNNGSLNINFAYCTGTYNFPKVYQCHGIANVYYENTFIFPSITTFWNNSSAMNPSAPLHLYFGPDLANIQGSNGVVSLQAANVDIHIPAGESTTKTTLDNNNITYTQDYVIPVT